ncbi:hypothetical protein MKQ70_13080 [Chitinophaga sedimenti]|uniref:hypothetical protein n=1 Tax=Chitinophaga sedimenti TaxID=2033606 RepID=UPI0020035C3F|nr:hypothetical protein [Chitinophaga sedimenti]MCK7555900.1 hypothetical protein [Chitinophaga sedimenti]
MRYLYFILILSATPAVAQDTLRLSLATVVHMAKEGSIASKQAATVKETKYWEWRTYRSNYAPQLQLEGSLPGFQKTYSQCCSPMVPYSFSPFTIIILR